MVLGVSTGATQGFSILISQHYGAKKEELLKQSVARSYVLTAIISVLLLTVSLIFARGILVFLNTPSDIIGMSDLSSNCIFVGFLQFLPIMCLPLYCARLETAVLR